MSRNIVICCDGTGNEVSAKLSNVLKFFRVVRKNEEQIVLYDPGVGTLGSSNAWARLKNRSYQLMGLATGYGLDENVLEAYRFLVENYQDGDQIFLFGFSRGAYTVRMLAGFLRLVGLVRKSQENLCGYALTAYKSAAETGDFEIAWRFERVISTRRVSINFMGVWDTVSSVIVPRPDRLYIPSLQELPYTKTNSFVKVFRHAMALDERRRMFRPNIWNEPQIYKPNPFSPEAGESQDAKQVWFAGVHADVGGGYSEVESGLAKFPLRWMIDEAVDNGLLINSAMFNHLVLGKPRKGGSRNYVEPDASGRLHESLTLGWKLLEWLPKRAKRKEWPKRRAVLGWYLPRGEPRFVKDGARVHWSVLRRMDSLPDYRPRNLPPTGQVVIEEEV